MKNVSKFRDIASIFAFFMAQTNIKTDRQTNLKMSDGKNINNGTTRETKHFQQKQIMKIGTLVQTLKLNIH